MKADNSICMRKKCCEDNDNTAFSKKSACCGSEKITGYSVLKKDDCCDIEKQGRKCSGTM